MMIKKDSMSSKLRFWFGKVQFLILAPVSKEQAESGRPLLDGRLSPPMITLINDTIFLGIAQFPDVVLVTKAFYVMSWCIRALSILAKKPSVEEFRSLESQRESYRISEEKGL